MQITYPIQALEYKTNKNSKSLSFFDSAAKKHSYNSLKGDMLSCMPVSTFHAGRKNIHIFINKYFPNNYVFLDCINIKNKAELVDLISDSAYMCHELLGIDEEHFKNITGINSSNDNINSTESINKVVVKEPIPPPELSEEQKTRLNFIDAINKSIDARPSWLKVTDLTWKYLTRNVLRSSNILLVGPSGCGKTEVAKQIANTFDDKCDFFTFNLGSTQDPRTTLIGNISYDKEIGTKFNPSEFIKAITTKNAIILLDEISRAHPEAWNILLTVLDEGQRYIQVDEDNGKKIKVAEGVCFIATANVGYKYTSTRELDRALVDRFSIIEVPRMGKSDELDLLKTKFPLVDKLELTTLVDILTAIRIESEKDDSNISDSVSTRHAIKAGELLNDGFTLPEILDVIVYPIFSAEGGLESERHFIKQIIDGYL